MSFSRAFKLSSYCLLFSGFVTLFSAGGVGLPLTGLYILVAAGGARRDVLDPNGSRKALQLESWQQLILVIAILVYFVVDFSVISGFVAATVHLLMLISLVKVFGHKTEKDYLLLYFISFAFLLLASTFTISVVFLASLLVYIYFSILTFILFESKKAYEENRSAHFSLKGYAGVTLLIALLIILVSGPIFITIPRGSLGLFGSKRQAQNLSGFSDQVNLGDIGKIIQNPEIVMRVQVNTAAENLPQEVKWRGIALDYYDGRGWSNTGRLHYRVYQDEGGGFQVAQDRRHDEFLVRQTFLLEPFADVLFVAPEVIQIYKAGGKQLVRDANDSFALVRKSGELLRYTVDSDIITRNERLSRRMVVNHPDESKGPFLQLPSLHPAVEKLADTLTSHQPNILGKALIIENFLRSNYGYSLDNRSAAAADPLYDFLFVGKEGHCEYFATAQAVLMRVLGIRSRVVNGFRVGEFNNWSGYFMVRQSDAHSWVEGYFPGSGWVEFDSTPAGPAKPSSYLLRVVGHFLDAIDVFWTEVVTFDRLKQVSLFRAAASHLRVAWQRLSTISYRLEGLRHSRWWESVEERLWSRTALAGLAVGVIGLGWLGYRYRRYFRFLWKQRVLKKNSWDIAPEYYLEMLDVLKRRGFEKQPFETPAEFANRVAAKLPSPLLGRITELYYRNRFGNRPLSSQDWSEIYAALRQLRHLRFQSS